MEEGKSNGSLEDGEECGERAVPWPCLATELMNLLQLLQ